MNASTEIAEAGQRFAQRFAANDVAGIADCYTEDAEMLTSRVSPVRGRAAIQSVFKFTNVPGHTIEFRTGELDVLGNTAIEIGEYLRRDAAGALADRGRYILVWKRVAAEWKIHRDMFSTDLPRERHDLPLR